VADLSLTRCRCFSRLDPGYRCDAKSDGPCALAGGARQYPATVSAGGAL